MDTSRFVNISDLRLAAKRRLPRSVFDYIDGGADGEITLRENVRAFEDVAFRPHCAVDAPPADLSTTVIGTPISMPIVLAPVGSSRMFWPRGEEAAAAAAGAAGTLYCLSTLSGCRLEDVRKATSGAAWFQLYICGGRDVATAGILRAKSAGYSALVVTIDTPVAGMRERDFRNGAKELVSGGLARLPYLPQFFARPGWLFSYLRDGGLMQFPNVMLPEGPMPYTDVTAALDAACVTWRDLRWIRDVWAGPIIIRACTAATTRSGPSTKAPPPSSSRTTVDGSWTASTRRFACCRKWWPRSAAARKCCSTAACAAAAMRVRPCASARAPC